MSLFGGFGGFGFGGGDTKTPKRRSLLDETLASRPKKPDPKPFSLTDSVGVQGSNRPKDVKKMERGLDSLGFMDTKKTGDSKGQFSAQLRQGMQAFQKANKLAMDGQANTNGPTATSMSQQLKKIRERREELKSPLAASKPFTSRPAPKPLAPKPLAPKPTPAPALPEKPKPWWRARRLEKISDADYSSTRRTLEGMLRYGDNGDFPNGEMIVPHDKKGRSPAQYYGGGGSLVLTPEEAKKLGLGKYTPPPEGWDVGIDWPKVVKKVAESFYELYKLRKGKWPK